MFLQILNNFNDVFVFYVGSAICFGWMAPKIWDLFKRDLAKAAGNEQNFNELSKVTQKNADEMISKVNFMCHAPKIIYNKINNIHNKSFPNKICQIGAMGSNINILKQGQGRQSSKGRQSSQQGQNKSGSKKSSDDNGDDGDGGEPPRLLNQAALAEFLCISKKSVQNQYSATPWLLPIAIHIPGGRGPRWTQESVQAWLSERPKHTPKTAPAAPQNRKVGRPRLAFAGKGGVA